MHREFLPLPDGPAILNHDLAGLVRGISAGTSPQPKVADGAIETLKLTGLPTDGLTPKTVEAVMNETIDLVVSVCDNAKEKVVNASKGWYETT